jgi:hypothetical protein
MGHMMQAQSNPYPNTVFSSCLRSNISNLIMHIYCKKERAGLCLNLLVLDFLMIVVAVTLQPTR